MLARLRAQRVGAITCFLPAVLIFMYVAFHVGLGLREAQGVFTQGWDVVLANHQDHQTHAPVPLRHGECAPH